MDFICQFFEDKKHVVRLYIATRNDIYRIQAEQYYKCPILFLNDFVQDNGNIFMWQDIQVMVLGDCMYIFDGCENYISIDFDTWLARNIYISDIEQFNKTWNHIHCIFAELCVGDIVMDYSIASKQVKVGDVFLPIRDKFAKYNNGKITRLCLGQI